MASQNNFHIVWFEGPQSILDKLSFVFSYRFVEKDGCLEFFDLLTRAINIAFQDVKNFLALLLVSSTKKETSSAKRRWVSLELYSTKRETFKLPKTTSWEIRPCKPSVHNRKKRERRKWIPLSNWVGWSFPLVYH